MHRESGQGFFRGPGVSKSKGSYESRSFDAQIFSQWGSLEWWSPQTSDAGLNSRSASGGPKSSPHDGEPRVEFFARSGNTEDPGKEWASPWAGPYAHTGTSLIFPLCARFALWRAVIRGRRPGDRRRLGQFLAHLPRNIAPVIEGIALQDPGVSANATATFATGQPVSVFLKMPSTQANSGVIITQSGTLPRFEPPPQGVQQKG